MIVKVTVPPATLLIFTLPVFRGKVSSVLNTFTPGVPSMHVAVPSVGDAEGDAVGTADGCGVCVGRELGSNVSTGGAKPIGEGG